MTFDKPIMIPVFYSTEESRKLELLDLADEIPNDAYRVTDTPIFRIDAITSEMFNGVEESMIIIGENRLRSPLTVKEVMRVIDEHTSPKVFKEEEMNKNIGELVGIAMSVAMFFRFLQDFDDVQQSSGTVFAVLIQAAILLPAVLLAIMIYKKK